MANYEGKIESTGIEVKNKKAFERILRLLGFQNCRKNNGFGNGYMFDTFERNGKTYFGILGYESVPNYLGECPNKQKCDKCPLRKYMFTDESAECPMKEDEEGDIKGSGDAEYDLLGIIQDHMKPGTKVKMVEVGNEKLRYLVAVEHIITKDDIVTTDHGVSWGDVEK